MFRRSLFVLLYFFFWPLCCLFFFDILILIAPLVSSNSSWELHLSKRDMITFSALSPFNLYVLTSLLIQSNHKCAFHHNFQAPANWKATESSVPSGYVEAINSKVLRSPLWIGWSLGNLDLSWFPFICKGFMFCFISVALFDI